MPLFLSENPTVLLQQLTTTTRSSLSPDGFESALSMKLMSMGNCGGLGKCSNGEFGFDSDEDGGKCGGGGGGGVVVVGVKLDNRSKELVTWALVKVAKACDQVIAVHVIDSKKDDGTVSLSAVKNFEDSLTSAFDGLCKLKQIDFKLNVSRGTPVPKVLAQEAKSLKGMCLVVGTSPTKSSTKSLVSVARYCAKTIERDITVLCVDNGKIMFKKEAISGTESKPKKRETPILSSSSSLRMIDECSSSSQLSSDVINTTALVPVQSKGVVGKKSSGWAFLRNLLLHNGKSCSRSSYKKPSVTQWILRLPSRRSISTISPDQEQTVSDHPYCVLNTDNSATVSPVSLSSGIGMLPNELEDLLVKYESKCRRFGYQELLSATSNFKEENVIGKGGSSKVYRAIFQDGKELAVKILNPTGDVLKQFVSEIKILTSLDHKNVISLLGFCFEENHLLLVYNILSRGSLEDNLHGNRRTGVLFGWKDRFKVALGVAEALEHLHNTIPEPIIHRDVKSSNILLSDDFEPKVFVAAPHQIYRYWHHSTTVFLQSSLELKVNFPQLSDFGLAMLGSGSSYHIDNADVAGTFGYLAPEYVMHGKVMDKIDVYAYGVVLLELLSGRKPIENRHTKGLENLVYWAETNLKGGEFADLLDPTLVDDCNDFDFLEQMVLAARLCIRCSPDLRPQMKLVVKLLKGDPESLKHAREEANNSEELEALEAQQSATNMKSFINLALMNLDNDDDTFSSSSGHQTVSVEDYLRRRCSRSSSFNR